MAVQEDYAMCEQLWPVWAEQIGECRRIVACSPDDRQVVALRRIFPSAEIQTLPRNKWDLNTPHPGQVDLIVANNVFHYSDNPPLWFEHVLQSTRFFWLQDLFMRKRGPSGKELQDDGDKVRYVLGSLHCSPHYLFDLSEYLPRIIDIRFYDAGSLREKRTMINFAAFLSGNLSCL